MNTHDWRTGTHNINVDGCDYDWCNLIINQEYYGLNTDMHKSHSRKNVIFFCLSFLLSSSLDKIFRKFCLLSVQFVTKNFMFAQCRYVCGVLILFYWYIYIYIRWLCSTSIWPIRFHINCFSYIFSKFCVNSLSHAKNIVVLIRQQQHKKYQLSVCIMMKCQFECSSNISKDMFCMFVGYIIFLCSTETWKRSNTNLALKHTRFFSSF